MKRNLILPFNGDRKLIDYYKTIEKRIYRIYFAINPSYVPLARSNKFTNIEDILYLLKEFENSKIKFSLLLNSSKIHCLDENLLKIINFLYSKGISSVVVTNLFLVEEIRKHFPSMEINISVISKINNEKEFLDLNKYNITELCVATNNIRETEKILQIKNKINYSLSVIVNSFCRSAICSNHDNHYLFNNVVHFEYNLLKTPFILPSMIKKYEDIFDYFKIQGKEYDTNKLIMIIDSYVNYKELNDKFYGIQSPCVINNIKTCNFNVDDFIIHTNNCGFNCKECDYCDTIERKYYE